MNEINKTGMKRALLLNDLSCMGKCSLGVAIPVISSYGIETVPLPTAMLSMQTCFDGYVFCDMTEQMTAFAEHWKKKNVRFDCIYTGFFSNAGQIRMTMDLIRDFSDEETMLLVDPVIGDNGTRYSFFSDEYVSAMRELVSMAHVATPNRTEAALLAGCPTDAPAEKILDALTSELQIPNTVITSVAFGEDRIGYLAKSGTETAAIEKDLRPFHLRGTGDTFASALCGELLTGTIRKISLSSETCGTDADDCGETKRRKRLQQDLSADGVTGVLPGFLQAVERAADFCDDCIDATVKKQPGLWYGLAYETVIAGKR